MAMLSMMSMAVYQRWRWWRYGNDSDGHGDDDDDDEEEDDDGDDDIIWWPHDSAVIAFSATWNQTVVHLMGKNKALQSSRVQASCLLGGKLLLFSPCQVGFLLLALIKSEVNTIGEAVSVHRGSRGPACTTANDMASHVVL